MSADDNAPEQAWEVEVVARAMLSAIGYPADENINENDLVAVRAVLAALAPIRAAERQEAARAAWDAGFFAAAEAAPPDVWHGAWDDAANPYRADGVTGRSGT